MTKRGGSQSAGRSSELWREEARTVSLGDENGLQIGSESSDASLEQIRLILIDKKVLRVGGEEVSLVLRDLYGEDGESRVQPFYLRGSSGYLLVADGTRADTLDTAVAIQSRTEALLGPLPFLLLVNKCDLEWAVQDSVLEALRQWGWTILSTSAKTGQGVEEAFSELARRILDQPQRRSET
jgi:GTPase SAR1 family protein